MCGTLSREGQKKKGGVGLPRAKPDHACFVVVRGIFPTSNIAFTQQTTASSRKKRPVHSSETASRQREAAGGVFIAPNGSAISGLFCFRFV